MEQRSLKFVVESVAGKILRGEAKALISHICTDSRRVQAGDLYFAIKGERFDGHDFLDEVASKGAAAVVIARDCQPKHLPECAVIAVDDPRAALGKLAAAYREQFSLPIVAVGGSNGKTTTKDLIASVLRQKFVTLASEASFNNDIGVPLTLLSLTKEHRVAVLETGTNHPGELAPLVEMVKPKFGVTTNIGREHLEFFGDVGGVVDEESKLAELLPKSGKLFLNGDDAWTPHVSKYTRAKIVRVGLAHDNDWWASALQFDRRGMSFKVAGPRAKLNGEYWINLLGRHQVANALFAIALGAEMGLKREEIQRGLAECQPSKMRLELWDAHGVTVLDDSYNANVDSMWAALQVLAELSCKGRRLAVLGDMAELGVYSEAAHEEVGRLAAEWGVGQLLAVGKMAGAMVRGAREAGLNRVMEFAEVELAAQAVKNFAKPGDVILLKASRTAHLERVAEILKAGTNGR